MAAYRVLPLFVQNFLDAADSQKPAHLEQLRCHLARVFATSVADEDIVSLLWTVFDATHRSEHHTATQALLLMHALCCSVDAFSLRTLSVLRALVSKLKVLDAPTEALLSVQMAANKSRSDRDSSTLDNLSPIRVRSPAILDTSAATVLESESDLQSHRSLLFLDHLLANDTLRPYTLELLERFDRAGIDTNYFSSVPEALHIYLPHRLTSNVRVYRDFLTCSKRPKLQKTWGPVSSLHIKTNIPAKSDVMYRFLIEGYNYGVNAPVMINVVGYTNRNWDSLGEMTKYGWPEGWDKNMCMSHAPGADADQYYSSDHFLVVRLRAKSLFCIGFSMSAWMVFHDYGAGFPITATVVHQDEPI